MAYGSSAFAVLSAPSAIAESLLQVSNFNIRVGDGVAGSTGALIGTLIPGGTLAIEALPVSSGSASVSINGAGPPTASNPVANPIGTAFDVRNSVGSGTVLGLNAGPILWGRTNLNFTPGTTLAASPLTAQYAAGASTSVGSAVEDPLGDLVNVQSIVSLTTGPADGIANSEQTLVTQFTLAVSTSTVFELAFDALGYFRTGLGQPGIIATAGYTWNANVKSVGTNAGLLDQQVLWDWSPNNRPANLGGNLDGNCMTGVDNIALLGTCTEFSLGTDFDMNSSQTLQLLGDVTVSKTGHFESELTIPAGVWQFTINHTSLAKATTPAVVPEPGSLALLGLGMLGMGAVSRRRKA